MIPAPAPPRTPAWVPPPRSTTLSKICVASESIQAVAYETAGQTPRAVQTELFAMAKRLEDLAVEVMRPKG